MEPVTIPKHIDDPVTLLVWIADEFAPAAFMLILGILIGQVTAMTILSVIAIKAYRRFSDNRPDGFPLHAKAKTKNRTEAGMEGGTLKGAGYAMDRLAHYYMDMAGNLFPVIEVDAARAIEFVVLFPCANQSISP
ncbi:MAG: type IV conjugative transfer system protein TraL [Candidatus Methylumidiphilus sp.]